MCPKLQVDMMCVCLSNLLFGVVGYSGDGIKTLWVCWCVEIFQGHFGYVDVWKYSKAFYFPEWFHFPWNWRPHYLWIQFLLFGAAKDFAVKCGFLPHVRVQKNMGFFHWVRICFLWELRKMILQYKLKATENFNSTAENHSPMGTVFIFFETRANVPFLCEASDMKNTIGFLEREIFMVPY